MQMVILEKICVMIMMSSWRQNVRGKSGSSMKKYVRTVYVSNESNKDSEYVSLGICRRGIQPLSFSGVCELSGTQQVHLEHSSQLPVLRVLVWILRVWSFVSMLQFLGNEQLREPLQSAAASSLS